MKHSLKETVILNIWLALSIIAGLIFAPYAQGAFELPSPTSFPVTIAVFLGAILIGAFMWIIMIRKFRPETVDWIWCGVFFYAIADFVRKLTGNLWLALGIFVIGFWSYHAMIVRMQRSWIVTRRLTPLNNVIFLSAVTGFAVMVGAYLSPLMALVILSGASIYDWVAVRKLKTMVEMAQFFIKRRIIPGIGIAKQEEGKFAMLGGGDVFFIILVATSFYKSSLLTMFVTAATMYLSVVMLFFMSKKDKFYPALPPIFFGALAGLGIVFGILAMG